MARSSSNRKITQSLWRNLLRRRQRDHATRVQAQRRIRVPKNSTSRKTRRPLRRFQQQPVPIVPVPLYVHGARLSIILLGSGAIAGTAMSLTQTAPPSAVLPIVKKTTQNLPPLGKLNLTQENKTLKERLETLAAKHPDLKPYLLVWEPATGNYVNLDSTTAIASASTIKIPIAMALLQQVDRGQIALTEPLTLQKTQIAAGSGNFGQRPVGSSFTVQETLTAALANSDNTATNMLIDRLGGIPKLNLQWRNWGLITTQLRAPLPDFKGTNQVTAQELALLLSNLNRGYLLKASSRQLLTQIMTQTKRQTMLPAGVDLAKAQVAHKTGELAQVIADAGYIILANGKKYIVVALVQRPTNHEDGEDFIRQISATIYAEYNRSAMIAPTP